MKRRRSESRVARRRASGAEAPEAGDEGDKATVASGHAATAQGRAERAGRGRERTQRRAGATRRAEISPIDGRRGHNPGTGQLVVVVVAPSLLFPPPLWFIYLSASSRDLRSADHGTDPVARTPPLPRLALSPFRPPTSPRSTPFSSPPSLAECLSRRFTLARCVISTFRPTDRARQWWQLALAHPPCRTQADRALPPAPLVPSQIWDSRGNPTVEGKSQMLLPTARDRVLTPTLSARSRRHD